MKFHSPLYKDVESGGVWKRSCRAGACDFRDPQTDPVGGVIGKGQGPDGKPDDRTCITRDPVPWFSDCEPVLLKSTTTLFDATRYCSYREQLFIPPPAGMVSRFSGKPEAWARIGGTHEQCHRTIEKEGAALLDTASLCDADLPALKGCCGAVLSALTCLADTGAGFGETPQSIISSLGDEAEKLFESFEKYCPLLCTIGKEELPNDCTQCTAKGGLFCPELKTCHCPSKNPPCLAPPITTPKQCWKRANSVGRGGAYDADISKDEKRKRSAARTTVAPCDYDNWARRFRRGSTVPE